MGVTLGQILLFFENSNCDVYVKWNAKGKCYHGTPKALLYEIPEEALKKKLSWLENFDHMCIYI